MNTFTFYDEPFPPCPRSLDLSENAARSEDFLGGSLSRMEYQRDIITSLTARMRLNGHNGQYTSLVCGRSTVVPPTLDLSEVDRALSRLGSHGLPSNDLISSLKVALLILKKPWNKASVTAFHAGQMLSSSKQQLEQLALRFQQANISLTLAILSSQMLDEELHSILSWKQPNCTGRVAYISSACSGRGLEAAEHWEEIENGLEQLRIEKEGCMKEEDEANRSGVNDEDGQAQPLYLANKSGLGGRPSACRHSSLDRLGHLSVDGMAKGIPTYATTGRLSKTVASPTAKPDMCYLQVQPIPRWRTLLIALAGIVVQPKYDDRTLVPQTGEGVLRVLQNLKEPHKLRMAWDRVRRIDAALDIFLPPNNEGDEKRLVAPIEYKGCELWEGQATFEKEYDIHWDTSVACIQQQRQGGSTDMILLSNNGDFVAGFWLQKRWCPACLAPPLIDLIGTSGTLEQAMRVLQESPPGADLNELRRDVKNGTIPVTAITVGPFPTSFAKFMMTTRAAVMKAVGSQPFDSDSGMTTPASVAPPTTESNSRKEEKRGKDSVSSVQKRMESSPGGTSSRKSTSCSTASIVERKSISKKREVSSLEASTPFGTPVHIVVPSTDYLNSSEGEAMIQEEQERNDEPPLPVKGTEDGTVFDMD